MNKIDGRGNDAMAMKRMGRGWLVLAAVILGLAGSAQAADLSITACVNEPNPFTPDGNGFRDTTIVTLSATATVDAGDLLPTQFPEISWKLQIRDALKTVVREFNLAETLAGAGTFDLSLQVEWDGRDDDGTLLPEGDYACDSILKLVQLKGASVERSLLNVPSTELRYPKVDASANVTVAGGGVVQANPESDYPCTRLEVPPGAVPVDTTISIRTPEDNHGVTQAVEFVYAERAFKVPAWMTLQFHVSEVPEGFSPEDMRVCVWDDGLQAWLKVAPEQQNVVSLGQDCYTVSAPVTHLSTFAPLASGLEAPPSVPKLGVEPRSNSVHLWWPVPTSELAVDHYRVYRSASGVVTLPEQAVEEGAQETNPLVVFAADDSVASNLSPLTIAAPPEAATLSYSYVQRAFQVDDILLYGGSSASSELIANPNFIAGTVDTAEVSFLVNHMASATDCMRVELVDPNGNILLLKDYGQSYAGPYDVRSFYNAGGEGIYHIKATEFKGNFNGTECITTVTVDFQPSNADTDIFHSSPDFNSGTNATLVVSNYAPRRGLIKFDITNPALPSGSIIQEAHIELFLTACNNCSTTITHSLHRLTRDWTELGATWNKYDGVNNWTTAGGDFNATALQSISPGLTANTWVVWPNSEPLRLLVQNWQDGIIPNQGLLIKSSGEVFSGSTTGRPYSYASRQNGTSANHPKLTIVYSPPEISGSLTGAQLDIKKSGRGIVAPFAKVEIIDPSLNTALVKDYGEVDENPYVVTPFYAGSGTYQVRLTQNESGTFGISDAKLEVASALPCEPPACETCDGCFEVTPPPVPSSAYYDVIDANVSTGTEYRYAMTFIDTKGILHTGNEVSALPIDQFTPVNVFDVRVGYLNRSMIGDMNGDGFPDIVTILNEHLGGDERRIGFRVALNDQAGSFPTSLISSYVLDTCSGCNSESEQVALVDLNGDHRLDVVGSFIFGSDQDMHQTVVLMNHGVVGGQVTLGQDPAPGDPPSWRSPSHILPKCYHRVAVGDLDRNGKPDLAMACLEGGYHVFLNNTSYDEETEETTWDFVEAGGHNVITEASSTAVMLGDFNGDGYLDMVIGKGIYVGSENEPLSYVGAENQIWINDRFGGFTGPVANGWVYDTEDTGPYFTNDLVAVDVDGDGIPELVEGILDELETLLDNSTDVQDKDIKVYKWIPQSNQFQFIKSLNGDNSGVIDVGDFNNDGDPDIIAGMQVVRAFRIIDDPDCQICVSPGGPCRPCPGLIVAIRSLGTLMHRNVHGTFTTGTEFTAPSGEEFTGTVERGMGAVLVDVDGDTDLDALAIFGDLIQHNGGRNIESDSVADGGRGNLGVAPEAPTPNVAETNFTFGELILTWSAPASSSYFTYNVRIGSKSTDENGGIPADDIYRFESLDPKDNVSVRAGSVKLKKTTIGINDVYQLKLRRQFLTGMCGKGTVYWSVQAVDAAYRRSPWSEEPLAVTKPTMPTGGTTVNANVSGTQIWELSGSPFNVNTSIIISGNLTIDPGVEVRVAAGKAITVTGTLTAGSLDTGAARVLFTTHTTEDECQASNPIFWSYLAFSDANNASFLRNCIMEYGGSAEVMLQAIDCSPEITGNIIRYSKVEGLRVARPTAEKTTSPLITDNVFYKNGGPGIFVFSPNYNMSTPHIAYNQFINNGVSPSTSVESRYYSGYGFGAVVLHFYGVNLHDNIYLNNQGGFDIEIAAATERTILTPHIIDKDTVITKDTAPYTITGICGKRLGGTTNITDACLCRNDSNITNVNHGNRHLMIASNTQLTLEPGVELQFYRKWDANQTRMGLDTGTSGVLTAMGTAVAPIRLTAPAAVTRPNWSGIFLRSSFPTVIDHCIIERASACSGWASSTPDECAAILIRDSSNPVTHSIINSTIKNSLHDAIVIDASKTPVVIKYNTFLNNGRAAILTQRDTFANNIPPEIAFNLFKGNSFEREGIRVPYYDHAYGTIRLRVAGVNLHDNTYEDNQGGFDLEIWGTTTTPSSGWATTWTKDGDKPYVLTGTGNPAAGDQFLTIQGQLTIEEGVEVQFWRMGSPGRRLGLRVSSSDGRLIANNVIFTVPLTDYDDPPQTAAPGDWLGIEIQNTHPSILKNSILKYATGIRITSQQASQQHVINHVSFFSVPAASHAIENTTSVAVDARWNYYGNYWGPTVSTGTSCSKPTGAGACIKGNILFDPWLGHDPFVGTPPMFRTHYIPFAHASKKEFNQGDDRVRIGHRASLASDWSLDVYNPSSANKTGNSIPCSLNAIAGPQGTIFGFTDWDGRGECADGSCCVSGQCANTSTCGAQTFSNGTYYYALHAKVGASQAPDVVGTVKLNNEALVAQILAPEGGEFISDLLTHAKIVAYDPASDSSVFTLKWARGAAPPDSNFAVVKTGGEVETATVINDVFPISANDPVAIRNLPPALYTLRLDVTSGAKSAREEVVVDVGGLRSILLMQEPRQVNVVDGPDYQMEVANHPLLYGPDALYGGVADWRIKMQDNTVSGNDYTLRRDLPPENPLSSSDTVSWDGKILNDSGELIHPNNSALFANVYVETVDGHVYIQDPRIYTQKPFVTLHTLSGGSAKMKRLREDDVSSGSEETPQGAGSTPADSIKHHYTYAGQRMEIEATLPTPMREVRYALVINISDLIFLRREIHTRPSGVHRRFLDWIWTADDLNGTTNNGTYLWMLPGVDIHNCETDSQEGCGTGCWNRELTSETGHISWVAARPLSDNEVVVFGAEPEFTGHIRTLVNGARTTVYNPLDGPLTVRVPIGGGAAIFPVQLIVEIWGAEALTSNTQYRVVSEQAASAGAVSVFWDGKTGSGAYVAPGIYRLKVRAVGDHGVEQPFAGEALFWVEY